jgi:hypothetical protein
MSQQKGSLHVSDDEHVLFSDINSPRTFVDIKENLQIAIVCLNAATQIQRDGTGLSSNYLMVSDSFADDLYPEIVAAESVNDIQIIKNKLSGVKERDLRQYFTISLLETKSYSLCQPWLKPREYARKINYELLCRSYLVRQYTDNRRG